MSAAPDPREALADLRSEVDTLYRTLADVAGAIARHLPADAEAPETLVAGIKAVHEHGFAMGAAHAAAQIADALGDEDLELEPAEHIGPTEPEPVGVDQVHARHALTVSIGQALDGDYQRAEKAVDQLARPNVRPLLTRFVAELHAADLDHEALPGGDQ